MIDSDKKRFAQIMTGLAEDCSAQLTSAGLAMRYDALKNYSIEQVESAVVSVMRSNVYTKMPTTGTIIQAIENTDADKSELQIKAIREEIRRIGSYGSPVFDDPVTDEIVKRRFGWGAICSMSDREFEFFAKNFKSAYSTQSKEDRLCVDRLGYQPCATVPVRFVPLLGGTQ